MDGWFAKWVSRAENCIACMHAEDLIKICKCTLKIAQELPMNSRLLRAIAKKKKKKHFFPKNQNIACFSFRISFGLFLLRHTTHPLDRKLTNLDLSTWQLCIFPVGLF